MTVCPHGSEVIPGKPSSIYIDLQYLYSLVPAGSEWIIPFLPFATPTFIQTADFCALEPPETPVFTADDLINLIRPDPISLSFVAAQKITQFFHEILWYRLCRCLIDSTPTSPPTPSAPPTDRPSVNPPSLVTGPQNAPCMTRTVANYNPPGGSTFPFGQSQALPLGATYFRITTQVNHDAPPHGLNYGGMTNFRFAGGQLVTGQTYSYDSFVDGSPPPPKSTTHTIPAGAALWEVQHVQSTSTFGDTVTFTVDIFCGSAPGASGICYPDPYVRSTLATLLGLTTLIQRQAAPFSYVYGANHTGLTGSGEISVQGLLGVSVDVTTAAGYSGISAGDPTRLFQIGRVSLGTDDGWTQSRNIDHDGTLLLPNLGGVFTKIGYTINPGSEVDIRELVREP